ncbi:MAG TPA: ATP synthase F0 subunit B [Terriglobales bacterium]|nr:ATP synthase F0 subunit B [Terriglobales bacterium]
MLSRLRKTCVIGLLTFGFVALCFNSLTVRAQAGNPPVPAQATGGAPQGQPLENAQQPENKTESKNDEASDTEAFRHSASVKALARLTGLSLDQTFWLSVIVNFIIVAAILWVLLKKTLPVAFRNRGQAIQKRMEDARNASEEARRRLAEVEGRLSRLDVEIAEIRRRAEVAAAADQTRILAEAEEERRRIIASTEQEISAAANNARRELKAYAAKLAVDLAGKKISVDNATDQTLVRDFVAQLGKDGR